MELQPGERVFDKYEVRGVAGQGGAAIVYKVEHVELRVLRAIKMLRADSAGVGSTEYSNAARRFQLEYQIGAIVSHPNIVAVHDVERAPEVVALVMEWAPGGSLGDRIRHHRGEGHLMGVEDAVRIVTEAADGLDALHEFGAVHRDVKPTNVLFDRAGRAKISDLGQALIPEDSDFRFVGSPHVFVGTFAYASPEQQRCELVDARADVYSLGAVLYEMLTNRAFLNQPGADLSGVRDDVPSWLADLLTRMVSADAESRPRNAGAVADELRIGLAEKGGPGYDALRRTIARLREENEALRAGLPLPAEPEEALPLVRSEAGAAGVEFVAVDVASGAAALWVGRTPVTNEQYGVFVEASGRTVPAHWLDAGFPNDKKDHPVTYVSWRDASAFCEWSGTRLPTESEWQRAAGGREERPYPWGSEWEAGRSNTKEAGVGDTSPVGKFPTGQTPEGLQDMSGNVEELCGDAIPGEPDRRPARGGSWMRFAAAARCSSRVVYGETFRSGALGFRVVATDGGGDHT